MNLETALCSSAHGEMVLLPSSQGPLYHSQRCLDSYPDSSHPKYIELFAQRQLVDDCVELYNSLSTISQQQRTEKLVKLECSRVPFPLSFQQALLLQCVRELPLQTEDDVSTWWQLINLERTGLPL